MDTRFLQTLLTVAETGSLTRTARALNLTPSAVMQRIKVLEGEIGAPLIHRSGNAMCVTAACAAILEDARFVVGTVSHIKAAAAGRQDVGLLRVGVIHTVLSGLMPDVMLALQRNRPGIELYILPGTSTDLYAKLAAGELDTAIIVQPAFAMPKTLEWTQLRQEPLLLITPRETAESDPGLLLKTEPFIRYDRNHWGGRVVEQYLRSKRIVPREFHELDSIEAITILVHRGLGVALIPDWLPPWPQGVDVRKLPIVDAPKRSIGLIWPKVSRRQPLVRAFADEVLWVAARLGIDRA
ncbi:DNA-binding transcriptional LysR family regulator [Bosea sp. OAE752]|jgi:DNA-binding transcriptional LysR family regulator|uniref:LysR family transcriptional regulator n=2 Tax=Bosea TaxID=85413 RepID=A0A927E956_9HYPH|nr:LysR family transcriptional regulator [Bosea spartocytisi]MBD3846262.1 LysR family transcriptional regulator [Bosea spartocytisi]MCT4473446.1 LysR family transcriptional regulator [Bosea spartocytisi]